MTYADQLPVNGQKYATRELAEGARLAHDASVSAAQERREKLAATFEAELKERFLATGATEDDWKRQKDSIIAKAREQATLARADVARVANRERYSRL
ncbi:MAG: hypothetical protein K0S78_3317 [Thermomicrobiales bacterium]|jgi:hypothetical protein|nr:hypothetical protein [Thermomicrobiales bacterium]